jgi:hypothetical protein
MENMALRNENDIILTTSTNADNTHIETGDSQPTESANVPIGDIFIKIN